MGQWHIEMLGHLSLRTGDVVQQRFYSRKVAILLAWLAYHPNKQFSRDKIIEMLWPDCGLRSGRANLRNVLAMLRRHLEPMGTPFGAVLLADNNQISLNPDAITSDVILFEAALDIAANCANQTEQESRLRSAIQRYTGDLLPGFFEDWVLLERERLEQRFRSAIACLRDLAEQRRDWKVALDAAWRLVALDPGHEETHLALIRLLVQTGQTRIAQKQYQLLWHRVVAEAGKPPGHSVQAFALQWKLLPPNGEPAASENDEPFAESATEAPQPAPVLPPPAVDNDTKTDRLPLLLTRTYGRNAEIRGLCGLLRRPEIRLLTITGLGGIGKTRLALETAHAYAGEFDGRIVAVALAGISQPNALPEYLLRALAVSPAPDVPIRDQLVSALDNLPTLLLLDNFEHLIDGGSELVFALLTCVPGLKCLITSRQRLNIDGEQIFPLQALALPAETASLEQLLACPSVQLLVNRGQAVRPEFQVTSHNAAAIAAVCRMLEGLPLAIELAAARLSVVPVTQMSKQLQHRLTFLVGRRRNVATRHHSIRAMLDWSFQLLTAAEQRFLMRLSVFRDGWTQEAAETVCAEQEALTCLENLCACSLLQVEEPDTGVRYRMLEMVREYAAEKLAESAEAATTQMAHFSYFLRMAEDAAEQLNLATDSPFWLDRLEEEHNNLRQALAWCLRHRDVSGLRLLDALLDFWIRLGYLQEARTWYAAFSAQQEPGSPQQAQALMGLGRLAVEQGDLGSAHSRFTVALEIARRLTLKSETAEALLHLGRTFSIQYDAMEARRLLRESLTLFRELGNVTKIAYALHLIANTHFVDMDYSLCMPLYEESVALYRSVGHSERVVSLLGNLGLVKLELGDTFGALQDLQSVLGLHRQYRFKRSIAVTLRNLADVFMQMQHWEEAEATLRESRQLFAELTNRQAICMVEDRYRRLRHLQGDLSAAQQFACRALTLCRELGYYNPLIVLNCFDTLIHLAVAQEHWEIAACLFGAREALRTAATQSFGLDDQDHSRRLQDEVQMAMGESARDACRSRGAGMSWEQAVEYALQVQDRA